MPRTRQPSFRFPCFDPYAPSASATRPDGLCGDGVFAGMLGNPDLYAFWTRSLDLFRQGIATQAVPLLAGGSAANASDMVASQDAAMGPAERATLGLRFSLKPPIPVSLFPLAGNSSTAAAAAAARSDSADGHPAALELVAAWRDARPTIMAALQALDPVATFPWASGSQVRFYHVSKQRTAVTFSLRSVADLYAAMSLESVSNSRSTALIA